MILAHVPYPSVSVETAAKLLRIHPKTLYRNMHEIPHTRIGIYYRVHVSFLFCEYVPDPFTRRIDTSVDPDQYELVYDVPIYGVRKYRNGEVRRLGDYEVSLSKKSWRNPDAN